MKAKRNLLIGMILSALMGWTLGFLRLPYVEKNFSFLLGFIACLALVSFGLILLFVWNKHALLIRLIGKDPTTGNSKHTSRTYAFIWIWVSVFIVFGGLVSSILIFKQNELVKTQIQHQNKKIAQQTEVIASTQISNRIFLMGNLLDKVDQELKNHPKRILSDATLARIAALSYSFQPYRYVEGDSLSAQSFSPERGQLLLALSNMNIDSSSLNKILLKAPFSGADLREADLRGVNLRRADLRGANLKDADLSGANLKNADLRGANFWGADLREADLSGVDLRRADLGWADLNEVKMKGADLSGAIFTDAKLKKADLSGAFMKWANLRGAVLHEANLAGVVLYETDLSKANLSKANLNYTYLIQANLEDSNLSGARLNKATVNEDNWLEKLNEWRITGAKEIQERYKVVENDSLPSRYRLKKIDD